MHGLLVSGHALRRWEDRRGKGPVRESMQRAHFKAARCRPGKDIGYYRLGRFTFVVARNPPRDGEECVRYALVTVKDSKAFKQERSRTASKRQYFQERSDRTRKGRRKAKLRRHRD